MKILSTFSPIKNKINLPQKQALAGIFTSKNTIDNKNLTKDTFTYSTNPINFTGKTSEEQKNSYKEVVKTLTLFSDNAQKSFEAQYKKDGVFAKSVDALSTLWLSPNRSKLVKKDIEKYKQNVDELNQSIENGKFTEKFEEIFKVKYEQKNIDEFNKASERLVLASTTKYMYDTVNETLKNDLKVAEDNKGELKDHVTEQFIPYATTGSIPYIRITKPKAEVYENMEKALTEAVGGKESLDGMLEAQNVKPEAKPEEKYRVYYNIAKFLTKTSKMTAEKCSQGKSPKELKKAYDEAYEKAFGKSNDIQKRVDNYNRSQQIGASMLKTGVRNPVRLALIGLMGLSNPLATIPLGAALGFGLDMLERATDKETENDLSAKSLKELMDNTAESYAYCAIEAGLETVLPNVATSNKIVNAILSTARDATVNVTTNIVTDYMTTGKWNTSQIAPRAFVQIVFGQISPNDELSKNLLSMTKGGVKDALLYDKSDKNSVKQFISKLQTELQKEYMKNPELYSSMKAIAMNNPEAFEKMIVELLQEHVDKTTEKAQQQREAQK